MMSNDTYIAQSLVSGARPVKLGSSQFPIDTHLKLYSRTIVHLTFSNARQSTNSQNHELVEACPRSDHMFHAKRP
jgi:hypothetical protein